MPIFPAAGVSLRPGSNSENVVQPVVDAVSQTWRPFSNAQTSPIIRAQNVDGSIDWVEVTPTGEIKLSGSAGAAGHAIVSGGPGAAAGWGTIDLSTLVALAPATSTRNLVQATADAVDLTLRPFSDAQTSPVLRVQNAAGSGPDLMVITPGGGIGIGAAPPVPCESWITVGSDTKNGVVIQLASGATPGFNDTIFQIRNRTGNTIYSTNDSGGIAVNVMSAQDTTDTALQCVGFSGQTANIFEVLNSGFGRVFAAGEDKIGVFGVTAVVQQTGGAATAGALYTATEQGMLNAVYAAMRAYGLLT